MKNYGTNNDPKSLATMGDLAAYDEKIAAAKSEANHAWGGRTIINGVSPTDASCLLEMSANRLLGLPAANVGARYAALADTSVSRWAIMSLTNNQKADLFSSQSIVRLGNTDNPAAAMGVMVTLNFNLGTTESAVLYCAAKKLLVKIFTGGIPDMHLKVEWRSVIDYDANVNNWTTICDEVVAGQPGWVSIPLDLIIGWHADDVQAYKNDYNCAELRLTMYSTSEDRSARYDIAGIGSIRLIAPTLYHASYDLATNNMPFVIDGNANPVFRNSIVLHNGDKYVTLYVDSNGVLRVSDANGDRAV